MTKYINDSYWDLEIICLSIYDARRDRGSCYDLRYTGVLFSYRAPNFIKIVKAKPNDITAQLRLISMLLLKYL